MSTLRRTSIFLNPAHTRELAVIARATGQCPSALVRLAVVQFIRREKRAQAAQVVIPGRARRQAIIGE
jgi:predicted transcriptional regulator